MTKWMPAIKTRTFKNFSELILMPTERRITMARLSINGYEYV